MSIQISCDGKDCRSKNFDVMYCEDCYMDLENAYELALKKIEELEKQLEITPKD